MGVDPCRNGAGVLGVLLFQPARTPQNKPLCTSGAGAQFDHVLKHEGREDASRGKRCGS